MKIFTMTETREQRIRLFWTIQITSDGDELWSRKPHIENIFWNYRTAVKEALAFVEMCIKNPDVETMPQEVQIKQWCVEYNAGEWKQAKAEPFRFDAQLSDHMFDAKFKSKEYEPLTANEMLEAKIDLIKLLEE